MCGAPIAVGHTRLLHRHKTLQKQWQYSQDKTCKKLKLLTYNYSHTCNDVGGQRHLWLQHCSHPLHQLQVCLPGIPTFHALQAAAAPTLCRHVKLLTHIGVACYYLCGERGTGRQGVGGWEGRQLQWARYHSVCRDTIVYVEIP